jgi:hypothetical protein
MRRNKNRARHGDTPIMPAFGRQRQKERECETSMGYIVRLCLKKKKKAKRERKKKEGKEERRRGREGGKKLLSISA